MATITRTLAAGALALSVSAGAALAADVPQVAAPTIAPVVVPPPMPAFDWAGFYVGTSGGTNYVGIPPYQVGGQAGFNIVRNRLVLGAEMRIGGFLGFASFDLQLEGLGRAGFLVRDRVLVYGAAGLGHVVCCNFTYWFASAGVEVGIGDRLSAFGEARIYDDFVGGPIGYMLRAGINVHF